MTTIKGRGHLFKRGNTYYLQYNIKGRRTIKSLHTTNQREAEKKREEILSPLVTLQTQNDLAEFILKAKRHYHSKGFLIDTLWNRFEKNSSISKPCEHTMRVYKYRITQFGNWLKKVHPEKQYMSDIDPGTAMEYAEYVYSTGVSHKIYNETLNTLARAFNLFKDESGIINNPFEKGSIKRLAKNPVSRKEFSKEEMLLIFDSFSKMGIPYKAEYEILFPLGAFAGLRLKDAVLLQWSDVNFQKNLISVVPYKTRKHDIKIQIPVHSLLKRKLLIARDWKRNNYVLPNIADTYSHNS